MTQRLTACFVSLPDKILMKYKHSTGDRNYFAAAHVSVNTLNAFLDDMHLHVCCTDNAT